VSRCRLKLRFLHTGCVKTLRCRTARFRRNMPLQKSAAPYRTVPHPVWTNLYITFRSSMCLPIAISDWKTPAWKSPASSYLGRQSSTTTTTTTTKVKRQQGAELREVYVTCYLAVKISADCTAKVHRKVKPSLTWKRMGLPNDWLTVCFYFVVD